MPSLVGNPEQIRSMYDSGMTQREIAEALGVARSAVHYAMCRYAIPRRPAIKRDQSGPRNTSWKGNKAGYKAFHGRVVAAWGKAASCSDCGRTDAGATYDWANVSGRYEDVEDYRPMCRSCHQRFDAAKRRAPEKKGGGVDLKEERDREALQRAADRLGKLVGTRLSVHRYKHGYVVLGCTNSQVGFGVGLARSTNRLMEMMNFAVGIAEDAILAQRRERQEWPGRVCRKPPYDD